MAKLITMCVVGLFVFVTLSTFTQGDSVRSKREITTEKPDETPDECLGNTPCGWAAYTPFTRDVNYYIQNVCVCPANKDCTKTNDDISTHAFVFRCRDSHT